MVRFSYIAREKTGKRITGSEDAVSPDDLAARLQAKDLIVVTILAEPKETPFSSRPSISSGLPVEIRKRRWHSHIAAQDMVLLCRQLATLLGAGVTILQSLKVIAKQISSKKLYKVLRTTSEDMERGLSLHEAMAKHSNVFSELWINLAESGEASGNLAVVLSRLASYLERNAEFRRKITSSLIYPVILIFVGLGALLFLSIKIIPTFANLFAGFNMKLPLLTSFIISASSLIRHYFFVIFAITAVAIFIFKQSLKNEENKKRFENFLFRLPMFGEFCRALVVERFSSGMATLVESGVPILYALEISERSVGSLVVAEVIRKVKEEVREGRSLSNPLEKSGFFEPMVVQMVAIGEEIGELSSMLKRINTFYQEYVDTFLDRFTAIFEPAMLIFMGFVIGIMVVGMFLPMFQLTQMR
jgi:type II secretory pathway component PulF